MKSPQLKRWSLRFFNPTSEKNYNEIRRKDLKFSFEAASKLLIVLAILIACSRTFSSNNKTYTFELVRSLSLLSILFLYYVLKQFGRLIGLEPYFLGLLHFVWIISEIESIIFFSKQKGNGVAFEETFFIASFQISICFSQMPWVFTWITFSVPYAYLFFRAWIEFDQETTNTTIQLFYCMLFSISTGLLSYCNEVRQRAHHLETEKYQQEVNFLHELIRENIPSPIIIAKRNLSERYTSLILFANTSCERLLNTRDKRDMLRALGFFTFRHKDEEASPQHKNESGEEIIGRKTFSSNILNIITDKETSGLLEYEGELCKNRHSSRSMKVIKNHKASISMRESQNENINSEDHEVSFLKSQESDAIIESLSSSEDEILDEPVNSVSQNKNEEISEEKRYFTIKAVPVVWDESQAKLLIFNEITDSILKSNVKSKERLARNKDKLLASVSHKLHTPLNIIQSCLDNIRNNIPNNKALKKQVKLCWRSSQLLIHSIGNLVDLSKVHSKCLKTDIFPAIAYEIVREVMVLVKFRAKLKGIVLEEYFKADHSLTLQTDPERLKQILLNLFDNAIKFTNTGGKIRFSFSEVKYTFMSQPFLLSSMSSVSEENILTQTDRYFARFTIEDTGIGIEKSKLPTLFQLASSGRLESSGANYSGGVCSGLALSQKLLKKILPKNLKRLGIIKVKSAPGKGSRFSFLIPLTRAIGATGKRESAGETNLIRIPPILSFSGTRMSNNFANCINSDFNQSNDNNPSINYEFSETRKEKNTKILIVDDDHMNQLVLKNYLLKVGVINYKTADNGLIAVEMFEEAAKRDEPFNVVLMDINMPVMNGYESAKKICELQRDAPNPAVIIAITANIASNDMEKCKNAGMDAFLTKPLQRKLFYETLEKYLGVALTVN